MEPVSGARTFTAVAADYDAFMGRYSRPLAPLFADFASVRPGIRALDVGCGPGALTTELVRRLGAEAVAACDPAPPFVVACRNRLPGVDVRPGSAEQVPFDDPFDVVTAQLVLQFVSDPARVASEFIRVTRPGGVVATCVWDYSEGTRLLRAFREAALALDANAPEELRELRFGREGDLAQWLEDAGLDDVTETTLAVSASYADFDDLWASLLTGIGPAGAYTVRLPVSRRETLRAALHDNLGKPSGAFTLDAVARAGRGRRA